MPSVFISYSWDSPSHRNWVRQFATDLRGAGVDAWLDQWEVQLGHDVTRFMDRGVAEADYVLLVCTENFGRKANERVGGVGYEQSIVTSELLRAHPNHGRFVCILRQGAPSAAIPRYMQSRVWVDCREDATYRDALQQILIHVFRRYEQAKPVLAPVAAADPPRPVPVGLTAAPTCWVLVAGTGTPSAFSAELEQASRHLGAGLRASHYGLVTCGWPGVDEWAARAFSEAKDESAIPLEDALVQFVVKDDEPAFAAGQLVFVERGEEEWHRPIDHAGVVLLLGGVGGVWKTGEEAIKMKKPVLPVAATGGDAKAFYVHMLKRWNEVEWIGLMQREFQQLARPGQEGIEAAVALAIKAASAQQDPQT